MGKNTLRLTLAVAALGCCAVPQAASARYIGLQCGPLGIDIYTDRKYVVLRPVGDDPAGLFEHAMISDDVFQGNRTGKDGAVFALVVDRKTALIRIMKNGTLTAGGERCAPRGAGAAVPPSDAAPAGNGNKF